MASRDSILEPGNLLIVQERDRFLSRLLRAQGWQSLTHLAAFEAGCSTGYNLRLLVQLGASPGLIAGMDVDPAAVAYVGSHSPEIRVHTGSAGAVPERDESFDLSMAFSLFSSVKDEAVARGIARELLRVTKRDGFIVVYDMRRRSPSNPNVHPIHAADIRRWFAGCHARAYSITLAPPIARGVGRRAPWLYGPLSAIPLLRTHAIYVIRPPALPGNASDSSCA
jgi:SAM-dependent methyltransferase